MPPNLLKISQKPVARMATIDIQTQGKNSPNTPAHKGRRAGGSSCEAAIGRNTM